MNAQSIKDILTQGLDSDKETTDSDANILPDIKDNDPIFRKAPDITLFGDFLHEGGTSRHLANLVRELVRNELRVELLSFAEEGIFYPEEISYLARSVKLEGAGGLATHLALWRYLVTRKPKVLLATSHRANIIAARVVHRPMVTTRCILLAEQPVEAILEAEHDPDFKRQGLREREIRRFYPMAEHVIAFSDNIRQQLIDLTGLYGTRIVTISPACIASIIDKKAADSISHPWIAQERVPLLLAVGRLARHKDFRTLLHAFSHLLKMRSAKLMILGDGPERATLETLVKALAIGKHVEFRGHTSNPYPFMAKADLFVQSSLWEGFPQTLVEALYLGSRIVATDVAGGTAEILQHGKYGVLVPPNDVQALSHALYQTLETPPPDIDPAKACRRFMASYVADAYQRVSGLQKRRHEPF